jgi:hypothetical protein
MKPIVSCALMGSLLGPSWLVLDETFRQLELTMAKRLLANTRAIGLLSNAKPRS